MSRVLDENSYAIMYSLDLSAAFEVVNIDLLIEHLKRVGMPLDVVGLVEAWLRLRFYYVQMHKISYKCKPCVYR